MDKYLMWLFGVVFVAGGFYFLTNYRVGRHGRTIKEHETKIEGHTVAIVELKKDVGYIKEGVDELKQTQKVGLQEIKDLLNNKT
jgi:hypothetical protein